MNISKITTILTSLTLRSMRSPISSCRSYKAGENAISPRFILSCGSMPFTIKSKKMGVFSAKRFTLNDRVLSFYVNQALPVLRILTDRGTEYCSIAESHDYQLYLVINEIEYTRTKTRHPQTNGICERFHKTILNEFYQPTLRRKIYG